MSKLVGLFFHTCRRATVQKVKNVIINLSIISRNAFIYRQEGYINLVQRPQHHFLSQFADDGAIWTKHSSAELAVKKLQKALDVIEAWGTYWGFKISPDKTKAIIFSRKIKDVKTDSFRLTLNGKTLDFVDKVTFLGLTMDRKLTWKHHIDQLIVKCNKDLNLMRMISGTTFGADKKCLVNLYKALILSKLDYGAQAFNSAHKSQLGRLNIIQNEALRIATRARRTTPIPALEVECGVLPLSLR